MDKVCISVVVHVYNCEDRIDGLIQSLVTQVYDRLDIIFVNDGSTDSTLALLENASGLDERIRILNIEHSGSYECFNRAIKLCKGKYIKFIEDDEIINRNLFQVLMEKIETIDADLVIFPYKYHSGVAVNISQNINQFMDAHSYAQVILANMDNPFIHSFSNKLYKKDIIRKNNLSFDSSYSWLGNYTFNLDFVQKANLFCLSNYEGLTCEPSFSIKDNTIKDIKYSCLSRFFEHFSLSKEFLDQWENDEMYHKVSFLVDKRENFLKKLEYFNRLIKQRDFYNYVSYKYDQEQLGLWKHIKSSLEKKNYISLYPYMFKIEKNIRKKSGFINE